jgi:hypothetical protein
MISNRISEYFRHLALGGLLLGLAACNTGGESTSLGGSGTGSGGGTGTGTGAGFATLEWVAPTARVNGDPISMSELGGYRVYAGLSPSDMLLVTQINDPYETSYQIDGLDSGTYYFYVTALDASGIESPPSETGQKTV